RFAKGADDVHLHSLVGENLRNGHAPAGRGILCGEEDAVRDRDATTEQHHRSNDQCDDRTDRPERGALERRTNQGSDDGHVVTAGGAALPTTATRAVRNSSSRAATARYSSSVPGRPR